MHARRVARNALALYRSDRLREARAKLGGAAEVAEPRETQSEVNAKRKALITARFNTGLEVIELAVCFRFECPGDILASSNGQCRAFLLGL